MWALPFAEVHPLSDVGPGLRSGFPGVQVDAVFFQAAPETLNEDVVVEPPPAIHGYADAGSHNRFAQQHPLNQTSTDE